MHRPCSAGIGKRGAFLSPGTAFSGAREQLRRAGGPRPRDGACSVTSRFPGALPVRLRLPRRGIRLAPPERPTSKRGIGMSRRIRGLLLAVVAALTAAGRLQAQAPAPACGGRRCRNGAGRDRRPRPVSTARRVLVPRRGARPAVTDRIVAAAADPAVSVDGLRVVEGDSRRRRRARRRAAR